jgi:hypothetical protein
MSDRERWAWRPQSGPQQALVVRLRSFAVKLSWRRPIVSISINQPPTDGPVSPPSQKLACRATLRRSRRSHSAPRGQSVSAVGSTCAPTAGRCLSGRHRTGMGGGSLMTPLLILPFGVHPLTAVGTDLLYAAVTKTAGTAIHSKKGNVDWRVAGVLAAGSVPATVLTIWVLSRMPKQSPTTATIISMSIGVALIIAAVAIFLRGRIRDYALARADNPTRMRYTGTKGSCPPRMNLILTSSDASDPLVRCVEQRTVPYIRYTVG